MIPSVPGSWLKQAQEVGFFHGQAGLRVVGKGKGCEMAMQVLINGVEGLFSGLYEQESDKIKHENTKSNTVKFDVESEEERMMRLAIEASLHEEQSPNGRQT